MDHPERWRSLHSGDGRWIPPEARPAATMVLLRENSVLLLKRSPTMPFAPGMHVFPGGGLSEVDSLDVDPLRACAIRETHEEVDIRVEDCWLFDRWVTPEFEDRRYDVWFFAARTDDPGRLVTSEAVDLRWLEPDHALALHRRGELPMLRPTAVVLQSLVDGAMTREVSTEAPAPKLPRLQADGRWSIVNAQTQEILLDDVAGPTTAETDSQAMRD